KRRAGRHADFALRENLLRKTQAVGHVFDAAKDVESALRCCDAQPRETLQPLDEKVTSNAAALDEAIDERFALGQRNDGRVLQESRRAAGVEFDDLVGDALHL